MNKTEYIIVKDVINGYEYNIYIIYSIQSKVYC